MLELTQDSVTRFGVFELDARIGELRKSGTRVRLQDQPLKILQALLEQPGAVVAREDLKRRIWPEASFGDFDHAVNVAVAKLRAALSDSADAPRYIETLPRRGYRFIYPVTPPNNAKAAQETVTIDLTPNPARQPKTRSSWIRPAAVATLAAVVLAAAAWLLYVRRHRPLTDKDSIVLADFTNTTGSPVFDGTLRQGLAVQLEQSPFLSIVSDYRIRDALLLLGQPADAKLTPDLARNVCWRTNSKVMLLGSISMLGAQYVVGLKAVNCYDGDSIAEEQVSAASKEQVLTALAQAAVRVRSRLGESLSTVQRFSAPIEQVTTPSLEALQAYSLGRTFIDRSEHFSARPYLERAIELDPNFAMAYASLGVASESSADGMDSIRKAYELRDRVSDRERFYIEAHYAQIVTGDIDKAREAYELWAQTYPRDDIPQSNLAGIYTCLRLDDKALEQAKLSFQLYPTDRVDAALVVAGYVHLNRFDEARAAIQDALSRNLDSYHLRYFQYELAFLHRDAAGMAKQLQWAAADPSLEAYGLEIEGQTALYFGQVRRASEIFDRAVVSAGRADREHDAALLEAQSAFREALFGSAAGVRRHAASARKLSNDRGVRFGVALAYAMIGDADESQDLADDLAKEFPDDTLLHYSYLPVLEAQQALHETDPARAIKALQLASPLGEGHGVVDAFYPSYVRGEAYLMARNGSAAAAEFQAVLNHSGIIANSVTGALARLGLARAYTLQGDTAKARAAYSDFLSLWKDADPNLPILTQAKSEFAQLK